MSDAETNLLGPQPRTSLVRTWGKSSIPPMGLASLIISLHLRPFQALPMLFTPALLFSSYLNVAGFKIDSAGLTAAWSGMYALLAMRREKRLKSSLRSRFSARGAVRCAGVGLGVLNCVAGGWVYATGNLEEEGEERRELNKWGIYKE